MLISDYKSQIQGHIHKDGEFSCLKHVDSKTQGTLCFLDDIKFADDVVKNLNITAVFTTKSILPLIKRASIAVIVCDNPRASYFEFHNFFGTDSFDFKSVIHPTSTLKTKGVSEFGVVIGEGTYIGAGTIIHPGVTIGSNTIIGCNNIIGGQGFEFKRVGSVVLTVKHFGGVKIGNFVETKEFVSIHKALFNDDLTTVGDFTKIDSGSHIGHGNKIGKSVFLCSKSNISGNSIIEDGAYIGPSVNVPNRLVIGKNSKVTVGSTVSKSIEPNEIYSGHFAIPHLKYLSHIKSISK